MALTAGIGLFTATLLTAALSRLAAEEIVAWTPKIVRLLVKVAVGFLPSDLQERFVEEWQGHEDEIPGNLSKLISAAGLTIAAWRIGVTYRFKHPLARQYRYLAQIEDAHSRGMTALSLFERNEAFASDDAFRPHLETMRLGLGNLMQRRDELAAAMAKLPQPTKLIHHVLYLGLDGVIRRKAEPALRELEKVGMQYDRMVESLNKYGELRKKQLARTRNAPSRIA
jgi:hypothetical protein